MQQIQTTLVEHEPKSIQGRNGMFTLHLFKAQDGTRFQTSKSAIANAAYGLLNQPVTIGFEAKQGKQKDDGSYWINNDLVEVVAGVVSLAGATAAPTAPTTAPTAGAAPTTGGSSSSSEYMRLRNPKESAQIHRQSAVSIALEAQKAGLVEFKKFSEVIVFSEKLIKYFEGGPAALAQAAGSGQAQQAAAPAVGGDSAGAEAPTSAPASSPEPVAAGVVADDDIPF